MTRRIYPGIPVGRVAFGPDQASRRFAFDVDEHFRATRSAGLQGERLAAQWSTSAAKTNIGTTFVDVYTASGTEGLWQAIDFTGAANVAADVLWFKAVADTGQQDIQAVDADNESLILFTVSDLVTGRNALESTTLPGWARNSIHRIKLQVKSTVATDDPTFNGASIRVR